MNWKFKFVHVEPGQAAIDFVNRGDSESWLYWSDNRWHTVITGDVVPVPLVPYCTQGVDPALALASAFQMGADMFSNIDVSKVEIAHLSMGMLVEEISNYLQTNNQSPKDCFRFWLGIALRVRK